MLKRKKKMLLVLDAGHGGIDNNGVYVTCPNYKVGNPKTYHKMAVHNNKPYFEGELNRLIVKEIVKRLPEDIDHFLTAPTYIDVPLKERVRLTNQKCDEIGAKNVFFQSIHLNLFNYKASGCEVFTTKGETGSDPCAEVLCEELEKEFKGELKMRFDLSDGDKDKEANYYVILGTKCRSVLSESLFFDSENDLSVLLNKGIERIAEAHVRAFIRIKKLYYDKST